MCKDKKKKKSVCNLQLSECYGPIMTVGLGPQRTVVLVGYEVVKDALVDHADDFIGRSPLPFLMKVTRGYGNILHIHEVPLTCLPAHVLSPSLCQVWASAMVSAGASWDDSHFQP